MNKINKDELLKHYLSFDTDNMLYALTILKGMGLKNWFRNLKRKYLVSELEVLYKNLDLCDMFNFDNFDKHKMFNFIRDVENGISYFNDKQLKKLREIDIRFLIIARPELIDKLDTTKLCLYGIKHIVKYQPHLKKYLMDKHLKIWETN